MSADDLNLAYCAGMLDVAGQIGLNDDKGSPRPVVRLRRCDPAALTVLCNTLGGNVREQKSGFSRWSWEIHGVAARDAIVKLKPYMRQRGLEVHRVLMWQPKNGMRGGAA